jgi:hypothetical protein
MHHVQHCSTLGCIDVTFAQQTCPKVCTCISLASCIEEASDATDWIVIRHACVVFVEEYDLMRAQSLILPPDFM